MPDVTFTVDGKKLTAPAGTLLIEACRKAGIEIPAFCYYPGLSLQAACRMCVVRQEKVPKLQTACTTTVAEGQVFITESPEIAQARKATIELLLGNHPLDCPVCDAGGECELQDMTFKYGAGESLYAEAKQHREEQQWSPAVFFDRPRCILCYRCVRMCGEGMDVWALGIQNRGVSSVIAPNGGDHLDCEQCGMCIDVCPVGALTSGSYRYKTRPWEMNHVSTVCTHCADGCKVTLGVRQANEGSEIVRADNRDKSGINGDFLCAKGRFGFDFVENPDRLTKPLVRNAAGKLEPATWEHALRVAADKLKEIRDSKGGDGHRRHRLQPHHQRRELPAAEIRAHRSPHQQHRPRAHHRLRRLRPRSRRPRRQEPPACATPQRRLPSCSSAAIPPNEHPLLAWNLRTNVRLNRARLYIANRPLHQAGAPGQGCSGSASRRLSRPHHHPRSTTIPTSPKPSWREESLLVIFGEEYRGNHIEALVAWGLARGNVRFAYPRRPRQLPRRRRHGPAPRSASRLRPRRCPRRICQRISRPARHSLASTQPEMFEPRAQAISAHCSSSAPILSRRPASIPRPSRTPSSSSRTSSSPQPPPSPTWFSRPPVSMRKPAPSPTPSVMCSSPAKPPTRPASSPTSKSSFASPAAMGADVKTLVPFGKAGVTADLGQSRGAQSGEADRHAVWLAANGLEPQLSPFDPLAVLDEIERLVPGYKLDRMNLFGGNDVPTEPGFVPVSALTEPHPDLIDPAHDGLFTSGTLGPL